ncbi:hypothetical protein H5410_060659 [Solanum commersonii]|uniref:Uncharacterized protein n=1 Tax=Solanum commersonii TaxID=4109 RepID=A0A9J5W5N4_SOLCO|nr:hypothetical protein H5410_060659 [Solanum commersonii]
MTNLASGQPLMEVVPPTQIQPTANINGELTYAAKLQPIRSARVPVPRKPITYLHGEPRVIWEEEEIS